MWNRIFHVSLPFLLRSVALCLLQDRIGFYAIVPFIFVSLAGCATHPPSGITPITPFDINRYVGKWYEIARLDHSFELGLINVSAHYRAQPGGSVQVINRGYDPIKKAWRQAIGHALFMGGSDRASLKVSFFGPFYGGYHVVALDQQDYRWAMVVGPNRNYLWILSRETTLDLSIRDQLLTKAHSLGLDTRSLIWVDQTPREDEGS